jgi:hypothetical protein
VPSRLISKNLKIKTQKTTVLPVVFYGCETWSLARKKVQIEVLRRTFEPKREEVVGSWRRLQNEELHNFYASLNIIRVIKSRTIWAEYVARMREMRNAYSILVRKPEGKKPFGRYRCGCKYNIKMDLREIRVERCSMDASGSGKRPVAGPCKHGNESSGSVCQGISCKAERLLSSQEGFYTMDSVN